MAALLNKLPEIKVQAFPDGHQVTTAFECDARNVGRDGDEYVVEITVRSATLSCTCGWSVVHIATANATDAVTTHAGRHVTAA